FGSLICALVITIGVRAQTPAQTKGANVHHATGPFDVKLNTTPGYDPSLTHMTMDKQFRGDLEATSIGEGVSAQGTVKGSAGYVGIERVTGKLGGRSGSFILQHSSTMTRGTPQQSVTVLPDSATGELTGLTGSMTIR